ncbi:MAG: FtsX-like permease family protein, partial [Aquisalimonadaceae bacterium]
MLLRASLRYLLRHPWQLGLSLLGVALGVAVVVAVDLANQSAGRAFALSSEALTGRTSHQVLGGPGGLDEGWYVALRRDHGLRRAAPVVEGYVESVDEPGRVLRVLGVDLFAESAIRPGLGGLVGQVSMAGFMGAQGGVVMLGADLQRLGREPGDALPVRIGGAQRDLHVLGALNPERPLEAQGLRDVLVMDIAAAQELLGRTGRLERVDLILGDPAQERKVRELLPADGQLVTADQRQASLGEMTRAFQLNLTAFSLLALVVGAFLIYNTMTFSVVQRRSLIGMLRAVGVTRREVFALVLAEALVIGAAGTAAGLGLGIAISHVLLELVSRTINDLYFVLSVRELVIAPRSLLIAATLGMGMTVISALAPAREATTTPPRSALSRASLEAAMRRRLPWLALAGAAVIGVGMLLLLSSGGLLMAFGGMFLLIIGSALLVPGLMVLFMRGLGPVMGRLAGLPGRMAARGVEAGLSRTSVATAALMVAVSAVIGVGVMVDSFRSTFSLWLDATLQADVYVSVPNDGSLKPEVVDMLRELDGVRASGTARFTRVAAGDQRYRLRVFDLGGRPEGTFRFAQGGGGRAWEAFADDDAVFVTEPFAHRRDLAPGDILTLQTVRGERRFDVAGVIYDYGSSEGAVVMSRALYERYWDDPVVNSVSLHAVDGVAAEALIARAGAVLAGVQAVRFQSNQDIRRLSLQIFDQTFTITQVLRLLAMLVAVVGVLSALLALALERAREFAVLRAMGLTPMQLWALVTVQNGLVGLVAGLLAIPLGLALAATLILVINQRSFGWSMQVFVPPETLVQAVALAVLAAVIAGLYPAWRMARTPPALA